MNDQHERIGPQLSKIIQRIYNVSDDHWIAAKIHKIRQESAETIEDFAKLIKALN